MKIPGWRSQRRSNSEAAQRSCSLCVEQLRYGSYLTSASAVLFTSCGAAETPIERAAHGRQHEEAPCMNKYHACIQVLNASVFACPPSCSLSVTASATAISLFISLRTSLRDESRSYGMHCDALYPSVRTIASVHGAIVLPAGAEHRDCCWCVSTQDYNINSAYTSETSTKDCCRSSTGGRRSSSNVSGGEQLGGMHRSFVRALTASV